MNVLSQAQNLFEKYTGDGAIDLLKSLPNSPEKTFENDWQEFKSGKSKDEDIKRIWSKAISGFANSEGGVIVWGLNCKKDSASGIDTVSSVELVPDVFVLKSRLMELRHGACDPPVANIEIRELQISKENPEGFVVCHIPESSMKPHRSEFAERRFYLRMGDSSRECNVSILRQLFYPKRNHRIEASIKAIPLPHRIKSFVSNRQGPLKLYSAYEISVRNIGEVSLEDVLARIECKGYTLLSYDWDKIDQGYDLDFIPPIVSYSSSIHPTIRKAINILFAANSPQNTQEVSIRVYAKDILPRDVTLVLPAKEGESISGECVSI